METCDNKSVGVIIRRGETFLTAIKRKNFPISYAFVAGHCDGDTFEDAARKEAGEEAGIAVEETKELLTERYKNQCRRPGGSWHEWKVFEAVSWSGEPRAGSDAQEFFWVNKEGLLALAYRTLYFAKKLNIPVADLANFIPAVTQDPEWQENPGLEPVWLVMLQKIGII